MIEWSEQHKQIREMLRRFVEAEIAPRREEIESRIERIVVAESAACPCRRRRSVAMGASITGGRSTVSPGSEMRKLFTQRISGYSRKTCWNV